MENEDYKFIGKTRDYFSELDDDQEWCSMLCDNQYYSKRLQVITDVISTYLKIKNNEHIVRYNYRLHNYHNFDGFTRRLGIPNTMSGRIVLAHFGFQFDDCIMQDRLNKEYDIYQLEKNLCTDADKRQYAAYYTLIYKRRTSIRLDYTEKEYREFSSIKHMDICTSYILEHIDTAIEYMKKNHANDALNFLNTSLACQNVIITDGTVKRDIDIDKLRVIANNIRKISKSDAVDSIIANMIPIIVSNKTTDAAKNNISGIKQSVFLCLGSNEKTRENINDIGNFFVECM